MLTKKLSREQFPALFVQTGRRLVERKASDAGHSDLLTTPTSTDLNTSYEFSKTSGIIEMAAPIFLRHV